MKRKKLFIIIGILIFIGGISIYSKDKDAQQNTQQKSLPKVDEECLKYFQENCAYEEIITYAQHDINNDKEDDLIVIYKKDEKHNQMVAVVKNKDKKYLTKPILAPKEDAVITFRDIDKKDEMEVMISGSKNGNLGYAIYRLQDDKFIDLFGEDMEACC